MTTAAKPKTAKTAKAKATPPKRKSMGRPSSYTPETAAKICALIAEGKSQREIIKMPRMPSQSTMDRWRDEYADFRVQYARARERQADYFAEEIREIADAPVTAKMRANPMVLRAEMEQRRQKIDAYKWTAAKLAPKTYGDRVQVDSDPIKSLSDEQLHARLQQLMQKAAVREVIEGTIIAGSITDRSEQPVEG